MRGDGDKMHSNSVTITNKKGLHARAAARFVRLAKEYDAEVSVRRDGQTVSGCSIMGLMMLAAGPGSEIELLADGAQSQEAIAALSQLVESRFDED
jgi:phosphocarrier protein HPr